MPRKPDPRCCRSCALWNIDAAREKIGGLRNDQAARCGWKRTEAMPSSADPAFNLPPFLFTMRADAGTDCPCWRERQSG